MIRAANLDIIVTLTAMTCPADNCGVTYGVDEEVRRQRRKDGKSWFCTNGHSLHYPGESDAEKLAQAERDKEWLRQRIASEQEEVRAARASLRTTKGHLTRERTRAAKAMCPVAGCKRHFVNVQRHIDTQHPGYRHAVS